MAIDEQTQNRLSEYVNSDKFKTLDAPTQSRLTSYLEATSGKVAGVDPTKYDASDIMPSAKGNSDNFFGKTRVLFEETGKAVVRSFEDIAGSTGGMIGILGDSLKVPKWKKDLVQNTMGYSDESMKIADLVPDTISKWGNEAKIYWSKAQEEGWAQADEEIFEDSLFENFSFTRATASVAGAIPSIASAVLIGSATGGSSVAGILFLSGIESEDVYYEAEKEGKTQLQKKALFAASFTGVAIAEATLGPLNRFLEGGSGKKLVDMVVGGVREGVTEGVQQTWQNAVAKIGLDKAIDLFEGVAESVFVGSISGGIMGGMTSRKKNSIESRYKEMKKAGFTDAEANALINSVADIMVNKSQEIDEILQKGANKTIKTMAEMDKLDNEGMFDFKDIPEVIQSKTDEEFFGKPADPLVEEAKKYKSAEEFVESQQDIKKEEIKEKATNVSADIANKKKFFHGTRTGEINLSIDERNKFGNGIYLTTSEDIASERFGGGESNRVDVNVNKTFQLEPEPTVIQKVSKHTGYDKQGKSTFEFVDVPVSKEKLSSDVGYSDLINLVDRGVITREDAISIDDAGKTNIEKWDFMVARFNSAEKARLIIESLGFDSISFKRGSGDALVVFDAKKVEGIKTKKQLTDIWNKAQEAPKKAEADPLIEEAKKYKSAEEFVEVQVSKETGFRDYHQAPRADKTPVEERMEEGGDFSLREVVAGKSTAPDDFFDSKVGARYYMYDNLEGRQSETAIDNIRRAEANGITDRTITAYRTVPDGVDIESLQNGDWVSFSKEYATQHGERRFDGKYKIVEQEVSPDEVWWDVNDINEWGYDDGSGEKRITQNARKQQLTDIWNKAQEAPKKAEADPLIEEAKKYKRGVEEFKALGFEAIQKEVFGVNTDDIVTVPLDKIEIKWKDDLANAEENPRDQDITDETEPVEFIFDMKTEKYILDDGHNRYVAAKRQGIPLKGIITSTEGNMDELEKIYEEKTGKTLTDIWNKAQEGKVAPEEESEEIKLYRESLSSPLMKRQLGELTEKQKDAFVTQKVKRLQKVDAYRKSLNLPPISKMTDDQAREYIELLKQFEDGDTFITGATLKAAEKTEDMKNIKTYRQAREYLAKKLNVKPSELMNMANDISAMDQFRYDTALAEKNPFFKYLVQRTQTHLLTGEKEFLDIENKVEELAKKAIKSRKRTLMEKLVPQHKRIMDYLEAPEHLKIQMTDQLTPAELEYAQFIEEEYSNAYDYLIKIQALQGSRFVDNYFTHIRRGFLETVKEDGIVQAFRDMLKQNKEDQAIFGILDQDTGNILPKEKFFQHTLYRSGGIEPSKNVTKAFKSYMKAFTRKKGFDQMIPELDIYVQSLTPTQLTPKGLEMDRRLKKLVYKYVNNKKGRRESFGGVIPQGGYGDVLLRMGNTLVSIIDLGLYIPGNLAAMVGEQAMTFQTLGTKDYVKGIKRRIWDAGMAKAKHKNANKILEESKNFIGKNIWEEIAEVDQPFGEQALKVLFGAYAQSSVEANKIFLLASLTQEELNNGKISDERLAELKLEAGRWRDMGSDVKSIVGSTSIGKAGTKYKTWAIPIFRTTINNLTTSLNNLVAKDLSINEKLNSREMQELRRGITASALLVMLGAFINEDDDRSFLGQLKARIYRESMTFLQGIDPTLFVSTPRLMNFIGQLVINLKKILVLEKYSQTSEHAKSGELKGVKGLQRQLTPGAVRQFKK